MSIAQARFNDRIEEWRTVPTGIEDMTYHAYLQTKLAAPQVMKSTFERCFGKDNVARYETRRLEESR